MRERWLPVVGYEGRYEVSDRGRVRNVETGHIKKPYKGRYHYVTLGHADVRTVHRLVLAAFLGPSKLGTRHLDGDNYNNVLDNIVYGGQSANMIDRAKHGRYKLTVSDVLAIRASGEAQRALAKRFGCTQANISLIKQRRKWAHV